MSLATVSGVLFGGLWALVAPLTGIDGSSAIGVGVAFGLIAGLTSYHRYKPVSLAITFKRPDQFRDALTASLARQNYLPPMALTERVMQFDIKGVEQALGSVLKVSDAPIYRVVAQFGPQDAVITGPAWIVKELAAISS